MKDNPSEPMLFIALKVYCLSVRDTDLISMLCGVMYIVVYWEERMCSAMKVAESR